MLLFLAIKLRCVSKNLQSAKSPGYDSAYLLCQQTFHVLAINQLIQQKYVTLFDPTPTAYGL